MKHSMKQVEVKSIAWQNYKKYNFYIKVSTTHLCIAVNSCLVIIWLKG